MTTLSLSAIFAAGVLTTLSPCVLPLAPVIVGGLVNTAEASKGARVRATFAFALGFGVVFVLLGLGVSVLVGLVRPLRPVLLALSAAALALFGLRMMHLLDGLPGFGWMQRSVGVSQPRGHLPGGLRALTFGAVFGLTWTPCAGPMLGGVLTYVAAGDAAPASGALMLASYALGVGTPLLLVAGAAEYVTPRLGRLAAHGPRFEFASGLALLSLSVALLVQIPAGTWAPAFGEARTRSSETGAASLDDRGVQKLVFFHSEHCPACRAMEAYLPELERACASASWTLVRVDVEEPANAPLLDRLGVRAVPTTALLDEQGSEVERLVGYQVRARLEELLEHGTRLACAEPVAADRPDHDGASATTCDLDRMC
ncbi:MAG TPA: cytochrome c biogenesis protein CcdA [Candidatus Limnocylindria bacterium]|nr:cytochrome c biogenesis protein CcdA [Candidatus Limnocylindria bacterium]